jgi:hypothetical protein
MEWGKAPEKGKTVFVKFGYCYHCQCEHDYKGKVAKVMSNTFVFMDTNRKHHQYVYGTDPVDWCYIDNNKGASSILDKEY